MRVLNSRRTKLQVLLLGTGLLAIAVGIGLAYVLTIMSAAPPVERDYQALETTVVYARGGEVLAGIYQEDRTYVALEDIPLKVRQAFIAVEDRNFYSHPGVDPPAILRALYANLRHRRIVEGGSTITQQLARNLYLDRSRTIRRKLLEIRIAFNLERTYSKDEILEMYLNHIYLGSGAYGVHAAANRYFDRDLDELSVDQAALLAALPRAPNYYSPFNNLEAAEGRRNLVLQRMSQNRYLTEAEAREAASRPLETADPMAGRKTAAPYFVEHVRRKLVEKFGEEAVYGEGLVVHTTLDADAQSHAEAAFENAISTGRLPTRVRPEGAAGNPIAELQPQHALVSIDPHSGAIRAMIGGRGDDEFNRAVQATRHPGSAFKPFIYAAAIAAGDHPGTVVNDIPRIADRRVAEQARAVVENGSLANPGELEGPEDPGGATDEPLVVWPRNFDDRYLGLVSYRRAIERSINTAAVEVLRRVGIGNAREHLDGYGFSSLTDRDGGQDHYALALGGLETGVSPLEMATAFAAFAAGGRAPLPYSIEKVTNRRGEVLYRAEPRAEPDPEELYFRYLRYGLYPPYTEPMRREPALTEAEAYIVTDMLRTAVEEGTGRAARLDVPVAGKTGTSDANHDAWFVGFTEELVSAVWLGEDLPQPMRYRRVQPEVSDQLASRIAPDGTYLAVERAPTEPEIILTGVHASMVWRDYMQAIVASRDETDGADAVLDRPDGVMTIEIDPVTGRAPEDFSPRSVTEIAVDDSPREVPWAFAVYFPTLSSVMRQIAPHDRLRGDGGAGEEPFWSEIGTQRIDLLSTMPLPPDQLLEALDADFIPLFVTERRYLRDSGIILGPAEIELPATPWPLALPRVSTDGDETAAPDRDSLPQLVNLAGEPFSGTYVVGPWEPIQQIDPDTGLPIDADEPVFRRLPHYTP